MRIVLKSLLAGLLIGLAASIYLRVGGVLGSALFSIGLIGVIKSHALLFTGQLGFIPYRAGHGATIILTLNVIGIILAALLWGGDASSIVEARLSASYFSVFAGAIGCGFLMSIAVISKEIIPVVMCVAAFILAGFPHCIADVYYYTVERVITLKWPLTVLGNLIGCSLIHLGGIIRR